MASLLARMDLHLPEHFLAAIMAGVEAKSASDDVCYYELLGVPKDADAEQITKVD